MNNMEFENVVRGGKAIFDWSSFHGKSSMVFLNFSKYISVEILIGLYVLNWIVWKYLPWI